MRHRSNKTILKRDKGPREALLKSLATSLILYEKIRTTEAKAKFVKPCVEKLITKSKAADLTAKRALESFLLDKKAVRKVLDIYVPLYKDRKGGYTRIIKLGERRGDNAKMVQIEFVNDSK